MSNRNDFIGIELKDEWRIKVRKFTNDTFNYICESTNTTIVDDQDYTGFLCHVAIGSINNVPIDEILISKPNGDKGIDIKVMNVIYDIKGSRIKKHWKNQYPGESNLCIVKRIDIENHPNTQGFIFGFLLSDESKVIITGYLTKQEFLTKSKLYHKGEYAFGFVFDVDNYVCHNYDLKNPHDILNKQKEATEK